MEQIDKRPFKLLSQTKKPIIEREQSAPMITNTKSLFPKEKKKTLQKKIDVQIDNHSPIYNGKERITVQISKATIERVKDCVYWNRDTVAQFVEQALEEALYRAEKENGQPFTKRRSELKPGRPTK